MKITLLSLMLFLVSVDSSETLLPAPSCNHTPQFSPLCRSPPAVIRCWSTVKKCVAVSPWSSTSPTCTCRLSCISPSGCRSCPSRLTCRTLSWARLKDGGCRLSLTRGTIPNGFTGESKEQSMASFGIFTVSGNVFQPCLLCRSEKREKVINIRILTVSHTLSVCDFFAFLSWARDACWLRMSNCVM